MGFPRVPEHEIIGMIVEVDERVADRKVGDRVGSGYHGGFDGSCACAQCKIGRTQMCTAGDYNGITRDGGLAEYCLLLASAAVHVPAEGDAATQWPAIQGLGGLGHLAIQYAAMMGYRVIVISCGTAKEAAARSLGAHDYIAATKGDVGDQLWALGGAQLALTTALSNDAFTPLVKGLRGFGKMLLVRPYPGLSSLWAWSPDAT
ncbi:chaperonin 10-like protein [Xylaria arbuscula]|nr:chaperonin 10-like protein [Xylaria arbuscula]